MPRIDFYVLPEDAQEGPLPTACRLCDKAVSSGKRVHVHVPDAQWAQDFDRLLWTFRQGSFIAHERAVPAADPAPLASVLIGAGEPHPAHQDVLLNLDTEVPAFFDRFERVLEIVHGDAENRNISRARFKFYRDHGCTPETHKL
jgi:DNA polymerase III subunit chi